MKKFFIAIVFLTFALQSLGQSFKNWEAHDVMRFYEKIELEAFTLNEHGEEIDVIYVTTRGVKDGTYKVEVNKVSSKLYQIRGTNIYMYFRFSPFLFSFDKGILEVSSSRGRFYEEP